MPFLSDTVNPRTSAALAWTAALFRLGLGVVFAWAAIPKLIDPTSFATATANYQLLPGGLVNVVAATLPSLELLVAVALLIGVATSGAALIVAGLNVVFLVAMVQARARGIDIDCGCFGAGPSGSIGWTDVLRDVAFLFASLWVFAFDRDAASLGPWLKRLRAGRLSEARPEIRRQVR